jgi:hypothetical protein
MGFQEKAASNGGVKKPGFYRRIANLNALKSRAFWL